MKESMKVLISPEIRQGIREEINKIISSKDGEFQELKLVFEPTRLKAEIRNLVKFETKKLVTEVVNSKTKMLWKKMVDSISPLMKEELKMQLNTINLTEELKNNFNDLLSKNMQPIIKQTIQMTDAEIVCRVKKRVNGMLNLKTSTLGEINTSLRGMETKTDEDYNKELENFSGDKKYLEYFKEVELK